jgi:hypothetical protein
MPKKRPTKSIPDHPIDDKQPISNGKDSANSKKEKQRLQDKEYARKYWEKMNNLFYRTIGHSERAFKVNIYINMILVMIGVIFVGYSIIYSWQNQLDLYSTAFGGIGLVSFIATFFATPQEKIQKTVGDLTQIQMCYRTYCMLWEHTGDYQRIKKNSTRARVQKSFVSKSTYTSNRDRFTRVHL